MDPNITRPIPPVAVITYRCPCGAELKLHTGASAVCDHCSRRVPTKALERSGSHTVSLAEDQFQLAQTHAEFQRSASTDSVQWSEQGTQDVNALIGKKFGHFELIAPLGHGGMGQVYRALDTSLQRFVAVKILRSGITPDGSTTTSSNQETSKLMQEAISQARVSHPNIVTIYYVGRQDGNPFLAMELMDGYNLDQRIAAEPVPFNETARIGLRLSEALQASYEFDIIHGDIKPSNVLMNREGVVKLSDFGMAADASDNHSAPTGGTPNYVAPELLLGSPTSIQSDMYALGVTLYEMTFGEVPLRIKGSTVLEWIDQQDRRAIKFPTPWPAHVPETWQHLLARLLAKAPEDRFGSYEELIAELTKLQGNSTVTARILPRVIAASVDSMTVLIFTVVLQVLLVMSGTYLSLPVEYTNNLIIRMCISVLPILAYVLAIYGWRQSIGRNLMHLRVVNQFGLKPKRHKIALRSLFRMQFPWLVILFMGLREGPVEFFSSSLGAIIYIAAGLVLLVDIGWMLFISGRSLHDYLIGSRVVLDTEQ